MRWRNLRRSDNIEDRRGMRPKMAVGGGLGLLVLLVLSMLVGVDPMQLLESGPGGTQSGGVATNARDTNARDAERKEFIAAVLASTEDVWTPVFAGSGSAYIKPALVLFDDQVQSACGFASSAVGPFYCPGDRRVYLDMSFFDELNRRFGAPGDFAQAYVIAHEIGHHVQNLIGTSSRVHDAQRGLSEADANALSVRLELQADYFAGVWAHHAEQMSRIIEPGDYEEAIRAASAIGDDRLQREAKGYVVPDSFTHGTSAQRVKWFRRGFESGDPTGGDTFSIQNP